MTDTVPVPRWVPPALQALLDAHPNHQQLVEDAYQAGVRSGRPYVSVDPAMRSGRPCINNTRLTVDTIADMVWSGETVTDVADDYDITRHDVLVACWYAGTYGLPGRGPGLAPTRLWRTRWGRWAADVHDTLWATQTGPGPETVPDPPSAKG